MWRLAVTIFVSCVPGVVLAQQAPASNRAETDREQLRQIRSEVRQKVKEFEGYHEHIVCKRCNGTGKVTVTEEVSGGSVAGVPRTLTQSREEVCPECRAARKSRIRPEKVETFLAWYIELESWVVTNFDALALLSSHDKSAAQKCDQLVRDVVVHLHGLRTELGNRLAQEAAFSTSDPVGQVVFYYGTVASVGPGLAHVSGESYAGGTVSVDSGEALVNVVGPKKSFYVLTRVPPRVRWVKDADVDVVGRVIKDDNGTLVVEASVLSR